MELPIKCSECGGWLEGCINGRGDLEIDICPGCENAMKEEARGEGYDEGYEDAKNEFEQT